MARPKRLFTVETGDDARAVNYELASRTAERTGLTRAWVKRLAARGDIPDVFRVGNIWCIPTDWQPDTAGESAS